MKLHKKIAKQFGYELIRSHKNHLTIDGHLTALFDLLGINCVIDVGANVGQYAKGLRANGYKGHIISFEPAKSTYQTLLEQSKNDPLWKVYPYALGREASEKTFHVTQDSSMASFHKINDYAQERYRHHVKSAHAETVQIKTLDSFWDEIAPKIPNPNVFLKLDTQGYDLEVLGGSTQSLEKISALQSEISLVAIYDGIPNYLTALEQYKTLGFEITGLYPVSRDPATLRVVEFDCVMIRSS